ncbi:MAG TPA: hydrogenase-1 expression HyaE [Bacteroidetes bacterium]|nr:hydrogenase-1 expression HyaE [Bacteroidota bacterium]
MFSPLLESIIERENWPVLTDKTVDDFINTNGETVLFISGNAKRFPESNDVAVILPEIIKATRGRLKAAVIATDSEREIQKRFHFNKFPALIFNRDGGYLGVIPKVLDWADYMRAIPEMLNREVSEIPGFKMPEGCRDEVAKAISAKKKNIEKDTLGIHAEPTDY